MLAFPSTYTVGITSLGYQIVWSTLAMRSDVDVRRLFTDQGDPPHGTATYLGFLSAGNSTDQSCSICWNSSASRSGATRAPTSIQSCLVADLY